MNLILLAAAWMLGIIAADLAGAPPGLAWSLAGAGVALAALGIAGRRGRWRPIAVVALALGVALLGAARLGGAQLQPSPIHVSRLVERPRVTLHGWVSADPRRTEEGQQVVLAVEAVEAGGRTRAAEGLVLASLPTYPEYRYGQRLLLSGELREPRGPRRPGEFDYRAYLRRRSILAIMPEPLARPLEGQRGSPALVALLAFRDRCRAVLIRELPEPQASIAVGVLLGLQSSIPDDIYATFSITGTSHILVVSGWNFTIVASVLAGMAARMRLGRWPAFWLSLGALWTYAFFVGATGTVLRAAVMASLMVLARAAERHSDPWRLLFGACWLLSAADPYTLWDLGFQLSALATASLFAFGKPVERIVGRLPLMARPWLSWAAEALTATLAAQILALPILLYNFGNLSLIAPLANIALVPVVPYVMLLGTLALVSGLVWLPLGQAAALAAWLPLTWMTEGARLLAQVPWAAVQIPPFPLWALLVYYGVVMGWRYWPLRPEAPGAAAGEQSPPEQAPDQRHMRFL